MVKALGGVVALVALGAASLLVLVSPAPASTPSAPAGEPAPSASPALVSDARVEDGRLLYLQTCASCHGNAGEGTQYAPPVQNSGPAAHDFYLRTGRMPLGRLGSP